MTIGTSIDIATLPIRRFGRTDMNITRVGFGAWAIGGADWAVGWGAQDNGDSVAAIRHAVARGINWIDTAAVYGLGHSEEVVGKRACRDPCRGAALCFHQVRPGLGRGATARHRPSGSATSASIRRELDASLRRLGVERIDLYPDALAGRGRHAARSVLADAARPEGGGQGAGGGALQP